MENKIGFGKYQLITMGILGLIDIDDGAQLILTSFTLPIIK